MLLGGGVLVMAAASGCSRIGDLGKRLTGHPAAQSLRPSQCLLPADVDLEAEAAQLRQRKKELEELHGVVYDVQPWEPDGDMRFTASTLAVSPDGTRIMAHESRDRSHLGLAEEYGTITWDSATGEVLGRTRMSSGDIAWHPTDDRLAVIGEVAVDLTDPAGEPSTHLLGHWIGEEWMGAVINQVRFSPDGTQLVTCGLDRTLRLWSTTEGTCDPGEVVELGDMDPWYLSYSPTGDQLVVAGGEGPFHRYDPGSGTRIGVHAEGVEFLDEPVYEPDGTLLAGIGDGTVLVVAPDGSESTIPEPVEGYSLAGAAASADGRLAVVSNPGDIAALWDRHAGTVQELPGGPEKTAVLTWAPDGKVLYALSLSEGVFAWDGENWKAFDLPD